MEICTNLSIAPYPAKYSSNDYRVFARSWRYILKVCRVLLSCIFPFWSPQGQLLRVYPKLASLFGEYFPRPARNRQFAPPDIAGWKSFLFWWPACISGKLRWFFCHLCIAAHIDKSSYRIISSHLWIENFSNPFPTLFENALPKQFSTWYIIFLLSYQSVWQLFRQHVSFVIEYTLDTISQGQYRFPSSRAAIWILRILPSDGFGN